MHRMGMTMAHKTFSFVFAVAVVGFTTSFAHAQTVEQHANGPKARVERLVPLPPPPPAPTVSTTTVVSPPVAPPKTN
jgi:hypothetical protein